MMQFLTAAQRHRSSAFASVKLRLSRNTLPDQTALSRSPLKIFSMRNRKAAQPKARTAPHRLPQTVDLIVYTQPLAPAYQYSLPARLGSKQDHGISGGETNTPLTPMQSGLGR
jgi:hypothetical protein